MHEKIIIQCSGLHKQTIALIMMTEKPEQSWILQDNYQKTFG